MIEMETSIDDMIVTGVMRENFLRPENRCDCEITAKTKRFWKGQFMN